MSFQVFSEPFPSHVPSLSILTPYMQLFLNVLVFTVQLPKEEKEKNEVEEGEKSPDSLNLLEITSARGGRVCNNGGRYKKPMATSLCLCDEKHQLVVRTQIPDLWRTGCFLPALVPVCYFRNTCAAACHITEGWTMGSHYCVKS